MGRFKLTHGGVNRIKQHLKNQVAFAQRELAASAFDYFVNFEYHARLSPKPMAGPGGWSLFYVANWNAAIGNPDTSIIVPYRRKDEEPDAYAGNLKDEEYARGKLAELQAGQKCYVTNSVNYGPWLNNGGFLDGTFAQTSRPNRFMELGKAYTMMMVKPVAKYAKDNEGDI